MTDQAAPAAAPSLEIAWGYWLWVAVCLVLGTAVFFPILVHNADPDLLSLVDMWDSDESYSYGYLIPPLAAYFVWEGRDKLRGIPVQGSGWGLAVLGLALLMLMVGMLGGVNFLPRASAVVSLLGGILWIGGWGWTRALLFPVLFLLLMIPIPEFILIQISFPLQLFAARVAEELLFLVNVPMLRSGNVITLAHTQLEVAEACSGLRSLLALVTTGVTFAYFFGRTALQRTVIVLSSIPIAIAVNALRVAGTGWLAHSYGLEVASGYYHTLEGFMMFGLAFALLALIGFLTISVLPGPATPRKEGSS
jgi:exosortase